MSTVHGGLGLIWHAAGRLKEALWYFPYPPGRFNVDGVESRISGGGVRFFHFEPTYAVMRATRYAPGYIRACTQEFVERGDWVHPHGHIPARSRPLRPPAGSLLSTGDVLIPLHVASTTRTQALRLVRQHVTCPACLVQLDELLR